MLHEFYLCFYILNLMHIGKNVAFVSYLFHLCFYILNLLHISENAARALSLFLHSEFDAYWQKCCMSFISVFTF